MTLSNVCSALPMTAPERLIHCLKGDRGWSADPLDTEQTVLMVGFRSLPVQHADALGLRLLQVHLGLGMSCRLFLRLREELGLVYDVGAELAMRRSDSPFIWHLSTSADQACGALEALLDEWQRLLDEHPCNKPTRASQSQIARSRSDGPANRCPAGRTAGLLPGLWPTQRLPCPSHEPA